ncbi:SIMPL domain-containing protein [Vibrio tapetis subsp. quintayensis]|uniref:SIMPL domain-containing protein n=1 Tax=Vibrio tapetis TaxID=52443 RepID=UPI0025B58311|nr:SIMPL domain-containing protein [Vibrio tapetis]MDN3680283.1 SIMPL domain-containing protein [Vibrio tapetis subsp. quintayensis]
MTTSKSSWAIGVGLVLGLALLGFQLQQAVINFKSYERVVTVKGLSEREYPADTVIWPIQLTVADNDLQKVYQTLETQTKQVSAFLIEQGIEDAEFSLSSPSVVDKKAQQYGDSYVEFRYLANQSITIYSTKVDTVRGAMNKLGELGKLGLVLNQDSYSSQPEYLFTQLNDVKPEMVEEATRQAREVAQKFAADSQSQLGKIKRASQGRFSISNRDSNTAHIKKLRVVSTVEYYLSD